MSRVAILTYNNAAMFELGCALEIFALPRPEYSSWYNTQVVSFEKGPFTMLGGLQMQVNRVESLTQFDVLVIPSWPVTERRINPQLRDALEDFHQQGKTILSFCSGAFLLARMGFLNGKQGTTHWRYQHAFEQEFPAVSFTPDVLYLFQENIACSAGSAAAIDLGIEFIRRDKGQEVANGVARRLVLSAHRQGGQAQFVQTPVALKHSQFTAVLEWAKSNLDQSINVNTLAKRANMSRRNFDRKFRATLNLSPSDWLTEQKLEQAKALLEGTEMDVEQIAQQSGFHHGASMRHHFRKKYGINPSQYRHQFHTGQSA